MTKLKLLLSPWLMLLVFVLPLGKSWAGESTGIDIENGQVIFNEGKGDATACQGCHGGAGLGMDAMGAPRLANIGQVYIAKQLTDFANGLRTPSGMGVVMVGIAQALSVKDRRDVAAYLDSLAYEVESSDLQALAAEGTKVGQAELGKLIVVKGIKGKVPACQDCHGFNGRAPHIPAINQQKYVYLINQMMAWKDGSRANDPMVNKVGIMRGIAKKITEDEIANISAYLSTAPRVTPE